MSRPQLALSDYLGEFLSFITSAAPTPGTKKKKHSIGRRLLPLKYKDNSRLILLANFGVWLVVLIFLIFWVAAMSH